MNQVVPFLDAVEREWKAIARELPSSVRISEVRLSVEHRKLAIGVEWPDHLAAIEAWEHAICLDIDVHNLRSKEGVILVWGPCKDQSDAFTRLHGLRDHIRASLMTAA